jgi:hypothetical protein
MSVKVSKVKDEAMGLVYYIFVQDLPDDLSPIRFLVWRCPTCKAEIKAWTPGQLGSAVRNHMRKHAARRGEEGARAGGE